MFFFSDIQFKLDSEEGIPESICSKACQIGLRKKYEEGESCCWTCHWCGRFEVSWYIEFESPRRHTCGPSLDLDFFDVQTELSI